MRLARAEQMDGRLAQRARPLGGRDDRRGAAVGDQAAVAHRERVADHRRTQHVSDGQRVARPRLRVHLRPLPRGDRDLGELLARRAELVHVARGGERVAGDRQHRVVRVLVRRAVDAAARRAPRRARRRAVGDQRDLAQPGADRRAGVVDMGLERRAADVGRVGVARLDPSWTPRSSVASDSGPAANRPSTSDGASPQSSSAARAAWAIRSAGRVPGSTSPRSDSATPTMAMPVTHAVASKSGTPSSK